MKDLKGKIAVITGAGSGIGRALAKVLAEKGCHLALNDYSESTLQETVQLLSPSEEQQIATLAFDVSDRDAVYGFADYVEKKFGRVDLVINNAGVALAKASVEEVNYKDLEWIMNINFWGMVYGTKAFLPLLKKQSEGALANISSVFGIAGIPFQGPYCASKFAIRGFTESLRVEAMLQFPHITIHTVHPGGIKTNIAKNARETAATNEEQQALIEKSLISSPLKTAETIIKGIEQKKARILVGSGAKGIDRLVRWMPSDYAKVIKKELQKQAI